MASTFYYWFLQKCLLPVDFKIMKILNDPSFRRSRNSEMALKRVPSKGIENFLEDCFEKTRRGKPNYEETPPAEDPYMKYYIKVLIKSERSYLDIPRNFRTNTKSRNIVVDWLIHVHDRYQLGQTILHKTVSLMDDFTSRKHVQSDGLQLVGIACMSLTIKNAGTPIESNTLVNICGSYFTKDDLHAMEIEIIEMAQFDLNRPVCPQFLLVLQEYFDLSTNILSLSKYFLDLWLFHHDFGKYRPSVIASAALLFSLYATQNKNEILKWSNMLGGLFKFSKSDLENTVSALFKTIEHFTWNLHPAVQEKYSSENFVDVFKKFRSLYEINQTLNIV